MKKIIQCCRGRIKIHKYAGQTSNIYIVDYPSLNRSVLIDCGLPPDIPGLLDYMKNQKIGPIEKVVCTHFHVDHCSGWLELIKQPGNFLIYFHSDAIPFVSGKKRMDMPGFSDFKDIMFPVMKENRYVPTVKEMISTYSFGTTFKSRFPMDRVTFFHSDDEVVPDFKTVHTPGHRPESVSFYKQESGILISGDFIIVINGRIVVNTYVYDINKQRESVEKVKKLKNLMTLLPGHGEVVDFNEKLLI